MFHFIITLWRTLASYSNHPLWKWSYCDLQFWMPDTGKCADSITLCWRLFRVSSSHATCDVVKTDAPIEALWDIFRAFLKDVNLEKVNKETPKFAILSAPSGDTKCSFELASDPGWVAIKVVVEIYLLCQWKIVKNISKITLKEFPSISRSTSQLGPESGS